MNKQQHDPNEGKSVCLTVLGCFGGLFIQLVIGSLYQWGIINIYVTSYFRLLDPTVTLQGNAIAFPVMMLCIGLTMRLGLFISQKTHPIAILLVNAVLSAACIFIASFVTSMGAFVALYGIIFGLVSGLNFMIPIVECNAYYLGKKMYINGVILIGTGAGSVVFGNFSYAYLNPDKIRPLNGYYLGTQELEEIAELVPECLRWLSLLYLIIGLLGVLMIAPISILNRRKKIENEQKKEKKQQMIDRSQEGLYMEEKTNKKMFQQSPQKNPREKLPPLKLPPVIQTPSKQEKQPNQKIIKETVEQVPSGPLGYAEGLKEAFSSFVCWYQFFLLILGSVGVFLVNGNYKTYVKEQIDDDEFLTIIGIIGSVGNGVSRFFWNLLFSRTGYKTVMLLNLTIQVIVYSTIRFTVFTPGAYLFLVFLVNCCLGGLLVMAPTVGQQIFGQTTGSNIYGFYWTAFAIANFIQFAFVAGVSPLIGFENIIYICLGMTVCSMFMVILGKFQGPWMNKLDSLRYCSQCCQTEQT